MNTTITYVPRNKVGEYTRTKIAAIKAITKKTVKIAIYTYLVLTFIGTVMAIKLVKETYVFKCQVNMVTIGYFSHKTQCTEANTNFYDSQEQSIEANNAMNLQLNPDLK